VDDNGFIVLCFGFLAPYKGLELVLDAARLAGRSITVVVAGGEHPRMQGVGGYGEELRARYGDIARFTGWVPDNDVAAWFAAADVAVFPYPRPFAASGVLALAMAHGCPVLMSPSMARCIGAPNVLAMPMNPVDLADTLVRLANAPDRLAELGGWAEILGRGRRWNAVAQQHTRLYEEVLDGQRLGDRSVRAG
jgi:glycosyltransferase involved in cell wall biosynthesis